MWALVLALRVLGLRVCVKGLRVYVGFNGSWKRTSWRVFLSISRRARFHWMDWALLQGKSGKGKVFMQEQVRFLKEVPYRAGGNIVAGMQELNKRVR